ncbi:hypothetical protein D3C72_1867780 [compost metagenome]
MQAVYIHPCIHPRKPADDPKSHPDVTCKPVFRPAVRAAAFGPRRRPGERRRALRQQRPDGGCRNIKSRRLEHRPASEHAHHHHHLSGQQALRPRRRSAAVSRRQAPGRQCFLLRGQCQGGGDRRGAGLLHQRQRRHRAGALAGGRRRAACKARCARRPARTQPPGRHPL